jgi:hypothetical protein
MAIRRNMSTPLSASVFDGGPKKKTTKKKTTKKSNGVNDIMNDSTLSKKQKTRVLQSHHDSLKKGGYTKQASIVARKIVALNNQRKLQ